MQVHQLKRASSSRFWAVRRRGRSRRAQPTPDMGLLRPSSREPFAEHGVKAPFVEGDHLAIKYRWPDNRLPALSAEMVQRRVAMIAALGSNIPARSPKAATTTIPIVFDVGEDPIKLGLVASIARSSSNLTRINFLTVELEANGREVLHALSPELFLSPRVDPTNAAVSTLSDVEAAARAIGLQIHVLYASTSREVEQPIVLDERGTISGRPVIRSTGPLSTCSIAVLCFWSREVCHVRELLVVVFFRGICTAWHLSIVATPVDDASRQFRCRHCNRVLFHSVRTGVFRLEANRPGIARPLRALRRLYTCLRHDTPHVHSDTMATGLLAGGHCQGCYRDSLGRIGIRDVALNAVRVGAAEHLST